MADQVMDATMSGGNIWKTMNTVGILGTLGAALGIGIPALVKANDAQDHDHRHNRDVDNDVVYLRSKIYTDSVNFDNYKSQVAYQEATNAKIAALDKENALLKQAQEYNMLLNNATFLRGQLYLPSQSVTPLPMDRYNSWCAPTAPSVDVSSSTTVSNG